MKKISRCLWVGLAAVSLLSLSGCGKAKSQLETDLVGSWKTNDTTLGKAEVHVYEDSGKLKIRKADSQSESNWVVDDAEKGLIRHTAGGGKNTGVAYEVKIAGENMAVRDVDANTTAAFVRVAEGTIVTAADDKPAGSATIAAVPAGQLTEADRKYIQMYSEVLTHINAADKAISRYWIDPIDLVLANVTKHFDAAWAVHVKHFGTPPRFYKADEDLRLGLKKWSEGLEALKTGSGRDEIEKAIKLIASSEAEYERVTKGLLGN